MRFMLKATQSGTNWVYIFDIGLLSLMYVLLFVLSVHCFLALFCFYSKMITTIETLLSLSSILFLCFFLFSNGMSEAACAHLD